MAKTIIIIFTILIAGAVLYVAYMRETKPLTAYETRRVSIGNTELEVFVADTPEKRIQGLMGIKDLAADTGMLFIFPDKSLRTFWNKNTLLNLDIIWIVDGRVVGTSTLPAITNNNEIIRVFPQVPIQAVIEINAGWISEHSIKIGDEVK
jgi:uncharacterized protein